MEANLEDPPLYACACAYQPPCFFPTAHNRLLDFPIALLIITDRLYLASYIHPPTPETLFPYPDAPTRGSPSKRSSRAVDGPSPVPTKASREAPCYFTVDDQLFYNAFHHDFGPFHIGHLYRFALQFHEVLGAKENQSRPIVFWSRADPRSTSHSPPLSASSC